MPQLARRGFSPPAPAALAGLARAFRRDGCVRLRSLLEAPLLAHATSALHGAAFGASLPTGVLSAATLADPRLDLELNVLFNEPELFAFVRAATGCAPIAYFCGRVHRFLPGRDHVRAWHTDTDYHPARRASLTLNLGGRFSGGRLQLRRGARGPLLAGIANTGAGDAVLFDPGPEVRHRNTPLTGTRPKLSFIGWFYGPEGDSRALAPGLPLRAPARLRRPRRP